MRKLCAFLRSVDLTMAVVWVMMLTILSITMLGAVYGEDSTEPVKWNFSGVE